jgi:RNA polymerase sigma factor (sigma-70 family)
MKTISIGIFTYFTLKKIQNSNIISNVNFINAAVKTKDDFVKKAIQKLGKEHQDILIWHYLEDMPIADIAKLVDKPAGTVRVMLHRGLKDLKDIVQES